MIPDTRHWTQKGPVKLFLWEKYAGVPEPRARGTILFVHGSSMASQPTFDLQVPGRPHSSVMEYFAERGFDCWCVDMEGYGRSDKSRDINCRHRQRRGRLGSRERLYRAHAQVRSAAGLRHFFGRAARGALRRAPSRTRCAPRARRDGLDRRREPDARRAAQEAPRVREEEPPADRPRLRAQHLYARPSRDGRRRDGRGLRRRNPGARRFDAERHLRRHVLEAAASSIRAGSRLRRSSCAANTTGSRA